MKRTRNTKTAKQSMLIYAASEFEAQYFGQVRKDCRYTNLTVMQSEGADSLEKLIVEASHARLRGKFDCAWVLVGFSDFNLKPADIKAAQELAEKKRVKIGWSNPSLSLWVYLHFKAPSMVITDPDMISEALAKSIPDYAETGEYLGGKGQNLHLALFTNFSRAIANAGTYNRICESSFGLPATNIPDIYADILKFCGNADITHNQKMLTKRA